MKSAASEPRATFTSIEHSTQADWAIIAANVVPFARSLPDRVMAHLRLLDGDFGGFPIDRLAHCLQTATLAQFTGDACFAELGLGVFGRDGDMTLEQQAELVPYIRLAPRPVELLAGNAGAVLVVAVAGPAPGAICSSSADSATATIIRISRS